MTLWNLKMYGYIGCKTKSYQILRGFLLLFIFYAFWPYKVGFPCFLAFWPYKAGFPCFLTFWPYKAGLLYFSEFPDLFSILLGAPRPLSENGSCPYNFLNHHKVPCHPPCGFRFLL